MSAGKAVLLLGRRDEPTDGVADYCEKLREAGGARGLSFEIAQVRGLKKDGAKPSPGCAKLPRTGAIAGFFSNTRRWHGPPADFLFAPRMYSMC